MHRSSGRIHFKFNENILTGVVVKSLLDATIIKALTLFTIIWYRVKNRTVKSATS